MAPLYPMFWDVVERVCRVFAVWPKKPRAAEEELSQMWADTVYRSPHLALLLPRSTLPL